MWENIKAAKFDAAYATMARDFVYAGPEGLGGREPSLAGLKSCSVHSYELGPSETRMIGKDALLVTYKVTVDTDCGPAPNRMRSADSYHQPSLHAPAARPDRARIRVLLVVVRPSGVVL